MNPRPRYASITKGVFCCSIRFFLMKGHSRGVKVICIILTACLRCFSCARLIALPQHIQPIATKIAKKMPAITPPATAAMGTDDLDEVVGASVGPTKTVAVIISVILFTTVVTGSFCVEGIRDKLFVKEKKRGRGRQM